jgi:HK97 family phage portal protein
MEQYKRYVYPIVSQIAENAAKVEFQVVTTDKDGNETIKTSDPFLELIKKPNKEQSQFMFLELHFTYMKLCGESFWYLARGVKSGKIRELYLLDPSRMEVVIDDSLANATVTGYVLINSKGERIPFDVNEILHFKMPNPNNPFRGYGPIEAGKTYILTEEYSSDWTKNAIKNSGRPSGVLNIRGVTNEDNFKKIKQQFKDTYSGVKNAGKTMLLGVAGGLDYQKLGMELGDIALKEIKNLTRDDIMIMFRMSKTMLGISDDVNRANAREARIVLHENVIIPEVDRLIDHLNAFLYPQLSDLQNAKIKYSPFVTSSEKEKNEGWEIAVNKWLTVNEIRAEKGLQPVEGGDTIYVPINMVPIESKEEDENSNNNTTDTSNDKPNSSSKPKEPQDSSDGEDMGDGEDNPEESDPEQKDTKPEKIKKKKFKPSKKKIEKAREKIDRNYFDQILATQDSFVPVYKELLIKEFNRQEKEIFSNNPIKGSKGIITKDIEGWLFDEAQAAERMKEALTVLGYEAINAGAKLGLKILDELDQIISIDAATVEFIKERILKLSEEVNADIISALQDSLSTGILEGETISQLRKRVQEIYVGMKTSHAENIARTEATAAVNFGTLKAYMMSPEVIGKRWYAEPDACAFCESLKGKMIGLKESFVPVGAHVHAGESDYENSYVDVNFPPLHPRCRCAILPVLIGTDF